jgi:hypothetical protein
MLQNGNHLYIHSFYALVNGELSSSDCTPLYDWMIREWLIWEHVEEGNSDRVSNIIPRMEGQRKSEVSRYPLSGTRFEPQNSRIQTRIAAKSTVAFGEVLKSFTTMILFSYLCNRLWRLIKFWDVETPRLSIKSPRRWRWGCRPYASGRPPIIPRKVPDSHFC